MSLIHGTVQTALPGLASDGSNKVVRADGYGAVHTRSEMAAWCDEGSYFKACNATMGTGIAMGIQTSWSATAQTLLLLRNSSATKKVIPHYVRLICTAAGSTTTSSRLAISIDSSNRYSSGGTDLTTQIVNANMSTGPTSNVDVLRFGIVTAAAAVANRIVANMQLKTQTAPCWTVGDEVMLDFMGGGGQDPGSVSGSAAVQIYKSIGPVVLGGPNHCMMLQMWNPANATTAPSWEVEMAWWER